MIEKYRRWRYFQVQSPIEEKMALIKSKNFRKIRHGKSKISTLSFLHTYMISLGYVVYIYIKKH
jgi:hypothetical protein